MLSTKQLKHLMAIVESGSLHGAAEKVYLSQSALTRSLKSVEEELGVALFERTSSGVTATPFCLTILRQCKNIVYEIEEIKRTAEIYRNLEIGEIRIGMGKACNSIVVSKVLPAFVKCRPNIKVTLSADNPEQLTASLNNRELDLIIAGKGSYQFEPGFTFYSLTEIPLAAFVKATHPILQHKAPSLKTLFGYPAMSVTRFSAHSSMLKFLKKIDIPETNIPSIMCSDYSALTEIMLHTDHWLIAPRLQLQEQVDSGQVCRIDINHQEFRIELAIIELKDRKRTPATEEFCRLCIEMFQPKALNNQLKA